MVMMAYPGEMSKLIEIRKEIAMLCGSRMLVRDRKGLDKNDFSRLISVVKMNH